MSVKKNYTAEEKAKVALEALKGTSTMNDISSKFQIHSTQITNWKNIAKTAMVECFKGSNKKSLHDEELVDELYRQIGQLKVELEWLKKKSSLFS
jgi:transposase-like protein